MTITQQKIFFSGLVGFGIVIFAIAAIGTLAPNEAKAAGSNDVEYESVLDYSSDSILLEEGGFVSSTTYNCVVATQTCNQVPSSTNSLVPSVLSGLAYLASPDYSEALVTTYTPGASPTNKLYAVQDNQLVLQATLPSVDALITNIRWSSDDNILIMSESDGTTQKYNRTSNTLTTLTNGVPAGASLVTISPNGRYIAYYQPALISTGKRTYGIIDTVLDKSYTMDETLSYWDLLSEGVRVFAFSLDSTHLLYLDDRSGWQTLYNVDLSTLATSGLTGTQITTKPYTIMDMQWINNSSIVFEGNRDNLEQWSLYRLNLNTYAITKISDWLAWNQPMLSFGNYIQFQTADANGRITKAYNTVTKAVSTFSLPGVSDSQVGTTNKIVTENGITGVYLPTTTATSTLVVWLHGGPDRQASIEYNSYMSYGGYDWVLDQLKASGVPVLKLNYPGSVDQGIAFASSVKDNVGVTDVQQTMKAINTFAATHGYKNIYLMGNSYGGYVALKMLVTYPDQIKGVMSLSGVTDWQALLTNIPTSIFALDFNGPPNSTNQALYDQSSVLKNIANIGTQKVVVIQGDADTEVPYAQSQLLDTALAGADKNVSYYTLNGEDHIYEQPSSYTLVCNQMLELVGLPDSSLCVMH
jgi:dipeptidyl aminopeptidase/acylaminoacyl peptidase